MKRRRLLAWLAAFCSSVVGCTPRAATPLEIPAPAPMAPPAFVAAPPEESAAVPVGAEDAVWGSRVAPVTLVVFADFECFACAELEVVLAELRERLGEDGLRVVFKHLPLPFHPHAREAAEVAQGVRELAGNDAFWSFYDVAFTTEDERGAAACREWAARAGVDPASLRDGMARHAWAAKVDGDERLAARLGVGDVPAVFVNGRRAGRDLPLAAVVEEERKKAAAALASGVPAADVYARMAALNRARGAD